MSGVVEVGYPPASISSSFKKKKNKHKLLKTIQFITENLNRNYKQKIYYRKYITGNVKRYKIRDIKQEI